MSDADRRYGALQNLVWDDQKSDAAILLAQGYQKKEVAESVGVNLSTIHRWLKNHEFSAEVDRLTLMYGIASKAERMRTIQQAARQFMKEDGSLDVSGFTLLDLLKEARIQMEGQRLDILSTITALTAETGLVDTTGSGRSPSLLESNTKESGGLLDTSTEAETTS